MKKSTHPKYQLVLFVDSTTGHKFVCGSTLQPEETETYQGKTYPVCRLSISSASHPFFTGSSKFVDAEGRVDKFRKRYAAKVAPAPVAETSEPAAVQKTVKKETAPAAAAKKAPAKAKAAVKAK